MTETLNLSLTKPVIHGDVTYSELSFREPTIGDLIVGDQFTGQLSKMTAVLASIADVPLPAFKKIGAKDFGRIVTATAKLLGNEQSNTTGG